jgi:hypothetical protein
MNYMSEKTFQMVVKYGPIVLGLCLLLNVWSVMRYREVYRDSIKSEVQVQQLAVGEQVAQAVLQEFAARANSDPHIAEIFKQAQALVPAQVQAQRNQLSTPSR